MKLFCIVVGMSVCIGAWTTVQAAPKAAPQTKGPSGEVVRYFTLFDLLGELNADAILKERRRGAQLISAELDMCHTVSASSRRRDRFTIPLKVEGNRLTGNAMSQEEKVPITVNLTRKVTSNQFTFEGTITRDGKPFKVMSSKNNDMSESDFQSGQPSNEITDNPKDFTEHSPQSVEIRVKRDSLANLISELRDQNVKLFPNGLWLDCDVLRTGNHKIALEIDPERVGPLLAKLKPMPGISAAGFSAAPANQERAVRFAAAGWRDETGKLDRDKLAKALEAEVKKIFSAQSRSSSWNATTGELTIKVTRNYVPVSANLGLTEIINVSILVGPETPSSKTQLVLWVNSIGSDITDEGSGPHLSVAETGDEGSEEPEGSDGLVADIASELHGERWDSDNNRWKR